MTPGDALQSEYDDKGREVEGLSGNTGTQLHSTSCIALGTAPSSCPSFPGCCTVNIKAPITDNICLFQVLVPSEGSEQTISL